ncbi:MAG TPA: S9 family peptidase, partial [Ktedonosporobacter sp.]|nr:S9 family peptidase [Ktedonosporobacter sp.]
MATSRKLTYDDLWAFKDMGRIALSPDGRRLAFVQGSIDRKQNEYRSALMLLHLDEHGRALGEPHKLTSGAKSDTYPAWAPDSRRLVFISNREDDKSQLWLIDTDGGEARKLTTMLNGVSEAAWSPDGNWIAFTAAAASTDDDEVLVGRKSLDEEARKQREDEQNFGLRTITNVWYRLDGRGLFEKFNHLFVMPAPTGDDPADPAKTRRLTTGDFDYSQPDWTPDSQEIGVLCAHKEDRSFIDDLWAIQRETGEARRVSDGSLGLVCYSWSPDGRSAVLVGAQDIRKEGTSLYRLHLVSREGGELRPLMRDVDSDTAPVTGAFYGIPGPYVPQWSEDGRRVYMLVTEHGRTNVCVLDITQDTVKPVT